MGILKEKIFITWISVYALLISNVVNNKPDEVLLSPNGKLNDEENLNSSFDRDKSYSAAIALEDEVEITITAVDMRDAHNAIRTHPTCITFIKSVNGDNWTEYHRTETSLNLVHAKFVEKVVIPLSLPPGEHPVRFELHSIDDTSPNSETLDPKKFLGFAESNLNELINAGEIKFQLRDLNLKPTRGHMIVHTEKLIRNNTKVVLQLSGPKRWLGKSNPYLEIYKEIKTGEYVLTWRTEVIRGSSQPKWNQITIPLKSLCNGDYDRGLKFVYLNLEEQTITGQSPVGEFNTTLRGLKERFDQNQKTLRLTNNAGSMNLIKFDVVEVDVFANLIKEGLRLHTSIAIDFTSSNGNPEEPGTLHYRDTSGSLTRYEEAIISGVTVLEYYDWDRKFPVFGFGARNFMGHSICETFHISPDSPDCQGVEGVLKAYRQQLSTMVFSWDTNFAPVIRIAVDTAKTFESQDDYYILFILTHGRISDFEKTESVLAEASALPISIIIVGIGDSSFEDMKKLADNTKSVENNPADHTRRDIVHFVPYDPMRKFHVFDQQESVLFLARKLLAEIPDQVASYRKVHDGIDSPLPTSSSPTSQ